MRKRGQVTIFIILGLVVMVVAGLFFLNSQSNGSTATSRLASEQELSTVNAEGLAIQSHVNSCLKQRFLEGKGYFGLEKSAEPELEAYIESTLPVCTDITGFEKKGLKVSAERPRAQVTVNENAAAADVYYPITVSSGQAKAELQSFNYYFKPESRVALKQGSDGRTTSDAAKVSGDGVTELKIPAGTLVTKDGQVLGEISIKVRDRNFDGLGNSVVLGEVVYEGLPDGAEFEPAIEVTMSYDDRLLPEGVNEEDLAIAYYDKKVDMWLSLESEVDTTNKKVTAKISHFTPIVIVVNCKDSQITEQKKDISESVKDKISGTATVDFDLKDEGDTCTLDSLSKAFKPQIECEPGPCILELNGQPLVGAQLKAKGNTLKITNKNGDLKNANGNIVFKGTGMLNPCETGPDGLVTKNCVCGSTNVNVEGTGRKLYCCKGSGKVAGKPEDCGAESTIEWPEEKDKSCNHGRYLSTLYSPLFNTHTGLPTGEICGNDGKVYQLFIECAATDKAANNGEWRIKRAVPSEDACRFEAEGGATCNPYREMHNHAATPDKKPLCQKDRQGNNVQIWEKCQGRQGSLEGKLVSYPTAVPCNDKFFEAVTAPAEPDATGLGPGAKPNAPKEKAGTAELKPGQKTLTSCSNDEKYDRDCYKSCPAEYARNPSGDASCDQTKAVKGLMCCERAKASPDSELKAFKSCQTKDAGFIACETDKQVIECGGNGQGLLLKPSCSTNEECKEGKKGQEGVGCVPSTTKCNNGKIDQEEQCDGNNLGGKSCVDFGYTKGNLKCNNDCKFDVENSCSEKFECEDDQKTFRYDIREDECKGLGTPKKSGDEVLRGPGGVVCCERNLLADIENKCEYNEKFYNEGDVICARFSPEDSPEQLRAFEKECLSGAQIFGKKCVSVLRYVKKKCVPEISLNFGWPLVKVKKYLWRGNDVCSDYTEGEQCSCTFIYENSDVSECRTVDVKAGDQKVVYGEPVKDGSCFTFCKEELGKMEKPDICKMKLANVEFYP